MKSIGFRRTFTNALRLWICKCKKIGQFFDIPKYIFWVEGAYTTGSRIEFLNNLIFHKKKMTSVIPCLLVRVLAGFEREFSAHPLIPKF
jgi:hypothetical protein